MRVSGLLYLLEQCLCACALLLSLGVGLGVRHASFPRLGVISLWAGILASLPAVAGMPFLNVPVLAALVLIVPAAAWPRLPRAVRLRARLVLLLNSLIMAGLGRLLSALPVGGMLLPLSLSLLTPLLSCVFSTPQDAPCITVEILCQGRHIRLTALTDSGNLLRDPLTGLPVIVVSRQAAGRLISLPEPDSLTPGMRLISVRTVAGASLMPIFRPGQVRLRGQGPWQTVRAMIGLSPDGYNGFQALVPASLARTQTLSTTLSQGG